MQQGGNMCSPRGQKPKARKGNGPRSSHLRARLSDLKTFYYDVPLESSAFSQKHQLNQLFKHGLCGTLSQAVADCYSTMGLSELPTSSVITIKKSYPRKKD